MGVKMKKARIDGNYCFFLKNRAKLGRKMKNYEI